MIRLADMTLDMPNAPNSPSSPAIAIIAYAGAQQSALFGLEELFDVANHVAKEISEKKIHHRRLMPKDLQENSVFDAVILPPSLIGARGEDDVDIHHWLCKQHLSGAVIGSACAGAYWLGYAGILDGRHATTHWALEEDFQSRFPKVHLCPEYILLDDNDVVTAGGVTAWVDLGVHLIGRWLGPAVVSLTCRQMLIDPTGREQRNYRSFRPRMTHNDEVIRSLQLWMEANIGESLSIEVLAGQAGLSIRSLQRRFPDATGLSVSRYVQQLRIEKAKGMLELTSLSVGEICWRVGYQDVPAFNRLFKSICGVSAGNYRRRFNINNVSIKDNISVDEP